MREIYRDDVDGREMGIVGDGTSYCVFNRSTGQSATIAFGDLAGVTASALLAIVADHLREKEGRERAECAVDAQSGAGPR